MHKRKIKLILGPFFLLILLNTYAYPQNKNEKSNVNQKYNQTDRLGRRQGFWFIAMPDGMGHSSNLLQGFYYNDKEIGVWANKTYDNKTVEEQIYFDTSRQKMQENTYYGDGNLKSTGYYSSFPCSDTAYQYDEKAQKTKPLIIRNKLLKEGLWHSYYQNGNIQSEGKYEKGEKQGKWKYFNENGEIVKTEDN